MVSRTAPLLSHAEFNPVEIQGKVLLADLPLVLPTQVYVLNDTLLQIAEARSPFISLIDRRSGALVRSLGRRGLGPGEFQSIGALANRESPSDSFWAYEMERRQLTRLTLTSTAVRADTALFIKKGVGVIAPVWLDDSTVVALNTTDSGAVIRVDLRTGSVSLRGPQQRFRLDDGQHVPPFAARQSAGEIRGCYSPSRQTFVRVNRYASRIAFISLDGVVTDSADVPYRFETAYEKEPDHGFILLWGGDQRAAYSACAATEKHLIALFSGNRMGSMDKPGEAHNAEFLHFFNWDGTLAKVVKLDQAIRGMALDEKTKTLYGVRFRPEPVLVSFNLASVLQ